jgi:hypothetical protein
MNPVIMVVIMAIAVMVIVSFFASWKRDCKEGSLSSRPVD